MFKKKNVSLYPEWDDNEDKSFVNIIARYHIPILCAMCLAIILLSGYITLPKQETVPANYIKSGVYTEPIKVKGDFGRKAYTEMKKWCRYYRVPEEIVLAIIYSESRFQSWRVNDLTGCFGYMQLSPKYFDEGGRMKNIHDGIKFLSDCYEKYHRWDSAIAFYAGGSNMAYGYANRILWLSRKF